MNKIVRNILFSLVLAVATFIPAIMPETVGAVGVNVFSNCGSTGSSGAGICDGTSPTDFAKLMHNVINTILIVLGMIAVIMIVIGGIRYTTSNGDSSQVQAAKNTVLYAVVGLVIAIMAYAIVNFVIAAFKS